MILRDTKAFPNIKHAIDVLGRTALHIAAQLGNSNMVALLLKYNSNPKVQDRSGCTPKDLACLHNAPPDVVDQFEIKDCFTNASTATPMLTE